MENADIYQKEVFKTFTLVKFRKDAFGEAAREDYVELLLKRGFTKKQREDFNPYELIVDEKEKTFC